MVVPKRSENVKNTTVSSVIACFPSAHSSKLLVWCVSVCVYVCVCVTISGKPRCVLYSVELQKQAVQLGQVTAQSRGHRCSGGIRRLLVIGETAWREREKCVTRRDTQKL